MSDDTLILQVNVHHNLMRRNPKEYGDRVTNMQNEMNNSNEDDAIYDAYYRYLDAWRRGQDDYSEWTDQFDEKKEGQVIPESALLACVRALYAHPPFMKAAQDWAARNREIKRLQDAGDN